jgi:hypothetical protein
LDPTWSQLSPQGAAPSILSLRILRRDKADATTPDPFLELGWPEDHLQCPISKQEEDHARAQKPSEARRTGRCLLTAQERICRDAHDEQPTNNVHKHHAQSCDEEAAAQQHRQDEDNFERSLLESCHRHVGSSRSKESHRPLRVSTQSCTGKRRVRVAPPAEEPAEQRVFFTGALHRMLKKNPIIIVGISVTSTPRHDFSFFNSITGWKNHASAHSPITTT